MIVIGWHNDFRFGFLIYTGGIRISLGWNELIILRGGSEMAFQEDQAEEKLKETKK
jgi:hypothetical protein